MESEQFFIYKMETRDLDEVISIETSSSLTPWSKNMFTEELANPLAYCYTIKFKGKTDLHTVGFICFRIIGDESELFNICVHPQYRKIGMGKKMMEFYIEFCNQMKVKAFFLDVHSENQIAVRLYQLFSYTPVGIRPKFYQGKSDALLMVKKF